MTTRQRESKTVRLAGRAVLVRLEDHALEDGRTWETLTVTVWDEDGKITHHANLSNYGKAEP